MPELPDIVVYAEALTARLVGQPITGARLGSPFLLRSVTPPLAELSGRAVCAVEHIGKRLVLACEAELFAVLHLMVAGRLHWRPAGAPLPRRVGLLALDFPVGTLLVTEASRKRRAALHLVRGRAALATFDRGGLDPLAADDAAIGARLQSERHTLKRALSDPRLLSGIGNAYSDEILHQARLSPLALTTGLAPAELARLCASMRAVLERWTARLRQEAGGEFPEGVTAFRDGMAVHGRFRQPCPACATPVQRIRYAEHETNYCPTCQTGGRLLADRSLSRLLKDDWPRDLTELEELTARRRQELPASVVSGDNGPEVSDAADQPEDERRPRRRQPRRH
jgi:formamidopyrimidine-DNA glycosylase